MDRVRCCCFNSSILSRTVASYMLLCRGRLNQQEAERRALVEAHKIQLEEASAKSRADISSMRVWSNRCNRYFFGVIGETLLAVCEDTRFRSDCNMYRVDFICFFQSPLLVSTCCSSYLFRNSDQPLGHIAGTSPPPPPPPL